MDLAPIGAHCKHCQTLDFLPIACPGCAQVFCRHHISFTTHSCTRSDNGVHLADLKRARIVEKCMVDECEDPRMRTWNVSDEADQGEGTDVLCEGCKQALCLSHRSSSAHACAPPLSKAEIDKAQTRSLIQASFSPISTSLSTKSTSARKKVSPALELMKLKQTAKPGRTEIRDRAKRWHLKVGIDLGGLDVRGVKRDGLYYERDTTIGQIVQTLVNKHSIVYNPLAGSPETYIYLLYIPLDFSSPVKILESRERIDEAVEDGSEVVLVKGTRWKNFSGR
ncbi:Predicted Zn-finger protein [Phaffia rhodozyma]|uniref:Predicted Zn-finger protein n=1 Tax=Phaffia rhodozyma TaxID=264483 RepID=A0A0F7SHM2_PHARH|nr:Predicted Zn-finger protein [Phaffia rhodozyma]